jgi:hypothetical protein
MRLVVDEELRAYLERLREQNMKAHVETWRQIAALEKRIVEDNAASHAETRLHIDAAVDRRERQFELFSTDSSGE